MPLNWGGGNYIYCTMKKRKKQYKIVKKLKKEVKSEKEKEIENP